MEKIDKLNEILRRFLTKGEAVKWDELREELGKEEYVHVKRELLRLRKMSFTANHEVIWKKIESGMKRETRRKRWMRFVKYAAVFVIFFSSSVLMWQASQETRKLVLPEMDLYATEIHNAYLMLSGGTRVVLDKPHVDTIRQDDGRLLAVDTLGTLMYNTVEAESKELSYHTIVVPRGGEYTLVLNDGSRVRLNADSELRFPVKFTSGERKVFLKGEAYFKVAHDTARPFRVNVHDDAMIEVLGTEFNINAYPENKKIFTTLVQGSVKVADMQADTMVVLLPNQQAALSRGNIEVKKIVPEDYITWMDGRFYFEKMSLEEILLQLERWYDLQVFWINEELKSYEFTGAVWKDYSIQQTLEMMEKTTDVHFTVSGRTVTVNYR